MQKIKNTLTKKESGFTLIELLVVIAIIAVLAALILAALSSAQKGSRDSKRKSDLGQYKTALAQYQSDNGGNYPTQATATDMTNTNAPYSSLSGTYMQSFLQDPKNSATDGHVYEYISSGSNFGLCVGLERQNVLYAVGPTFSGDVPSSTRTTACTERG